MRKGEGLVLFGLHGLELCKKLKHSHAKSLGSKKFRGAKMVTEGEVDRASVETVDWSYMNHACHRLHASSFKGQGHLALVQLPFLRASRPFSVLITGIKAIRNKTTLANTAHRYDGKDLVFPQSCHYIQSHSLELLLVVAPCS